MSSLLQSWMPWKPATTASLRGLRPTRYDLSFEGIATNTPSRDDYFEMHLNQTFLNILEYVQATFGVADLPTRRSPWLQMDSDEFITYAASLAHPGSDNDWDFLLLNGDERSFLIASVIMKALDIHVFNHMLFGADEDHVRILKEQDKCFVTLEGFQRSSLRAQSNRAYLDSVDDVPPLFWKSVDKVASQIFIMLAPIYNAISYSHAKEVAPLDAAFQGMHNIVAYAGWLNLAIRVVPAIITFDWPKPGDDYALDQVNIHHGAYNYSKTKTEQKDSLLEMANKPRRVPRVKMCAGPEITRHGIHISNGITSQTSAKLMRPHVMYYSGHQSSQEEPCIPLQKYKRDLEMGRAVGKYGVLFWCMLLLVAILYVWFWRQVLALTKPIRSGVGL